MADEITIEEIVINSNIETIFDKIAGGEAADNNTAGERVEELTIDPSVELAVLEAADRVDEEADENIVEEIVINSSIEAITDKFAGDEAINDNAIYPSVELAVLEAVDRVGEEADEDTIDKIARIEAVLDKIAGDEAINDNTIDPFVELVVLAADRVGEEADEDIVEKLSSIQVLRRLLIILSIH